MQEDTNELIRNMATLISAMQRREESLKSVINTELGNLHRSIEGVDGRISRATEAVPKEVANRVGPALDRITKQMDDRLGQSTRHLSEAADRYAKAQDSKVATLQKRVTWMSASMALLSVLMLASIAYFANANRHMVDERQRLQREIGWLDRVNRADIVPCGEGLCANVNLHTKGVGGQGQYRAVNPRPAAAK